jgi:5'-nucleotidase
MKRKAILGIDIDGTTGYYVEALRKFCVQKLGIPEERAMIEFPVPIDYQFSNWKLLEGNFKNFHCDAVAEGLYEWMDAIPDASSTLWRLNDEDYHIHFITSRFVKHNMNQQVVVSTAIWLDKHKMPYRDLSFKEDKADVYADIYIDDSPSNIKAFQEKGRHVIIFDAPYNQGMAGLRAYNWQDVYNHIHNIYPEGWIEKDKH